MTWAGTAVAVAGLGASMYGANKSAKATAKANAQNIAANQESDRLNFQQWLMSRGIGTNGQPVNTKLPFWMGARVRYPSAGGAGRIVGPAVAPSAPYQMPSSTLK